MNILCVYVGGGKGHYIPAKAVSDQLTQMGHNAVLIDFFELIKMNPIGKINVMLWRKLLQRPDLENKFSKHNDQNTKEIQWVSSVLQVIRKRRFKHIIKTYRPDMIFTTHPYAGYFLADLAARFAPSIPVTYYATDVFFVPMSAVNNNLCSMYVATEEGCKSAADNGQRADSIKLCPFPLQASCKAGQKLTKAAARRRIGLKEDVFTLQLNLGGEGIGSLELLEGLKCIDSPMQVVVIGGIKEKIKSRIEQIKATLPAHINVFIPGFVHNVNDYALASDIIAGRSGINTLVECFYLHRPFMITELVYTVMASADYVEKYGVGWNLNKDIDKQLSLITMFAKKPTLLDELDKNFDAIPIIYDAAGLAKMVVDDTLSFKSK